MFDCLRFCTDITTTSKTLNAEDFVLVIKLTSNNLNADNITYKNTKRWKHDEILK